MYNLRMRLFTIMLGLMAKILPDNLNSSDAQMVREIGMIMARYNG